MVRKLSIFFVFLVYAKLFSSIKIRFNYIGRIKKYIKDKFGGFVY